MQRGEESVVVADDREVVRDAKPGILEAVDQTRGDEVVRGEHRRGEPGACREQLLRGVHARRVGVVARHDARLAREAELSHRLPVAGAPRPRARAAPAVDVRDAPVAELREVPDDEAGPRELVVRDRVDVLRADRARDDDDRRDRRRGEDVARRQPRPDEDDAVGAHLEERLERLLLAPCAPARGADQRPVVERRGVLVDAVHDLGVERVVELVEDDADRPRPAAREPARHRVRAVAEPGRRSEHGLAARVAHLRAAADDERDEGARHPRSPRHVLHRHPALDTGHVTSDNRRDR